MMTLRERRWAGVLLLSLSAASMAADNDVVNIGRDATLEAGRRAATVVSILGSSVSEGDAHAVIAVFGDARVTGPVEDSVVAVAGDTYADSKLGGDVIAVLGNVKLGPNAEVAGNAVAVGGQVEVDPAAIVHGDTRSVGLGHFAGAGWIRPWIRNCLIYGRPLSVSSGLDWAWALALAFLALYVATSWLFRDAVMRCAQSVETSPGLTIVAAFFSVLLLPVLVALLCISLIGIVALPFVAVAFLAAALVGKAAILACLGRRMGSAPATRPVLAVLLGGLLVLLLYVIPVVGFVVFTVLWMLGLGAASYTLISGWSSRGRGKRPAAGPAAMGPAEPSAAPAPAPPGIAARAGADAALLPRAGFWVRMVALLIDVLIVGFVMHVLHDGIHLELVALAAYGAAMWKLRGSSVGGLVFDLRVVRLDGRDIDWETAIVRALGCLLSFAAAGLGFFWIAFDGAKQAWHDKIAGTVVVRVPKAIPADVPSSGV